MKTSVVETFFSNFFKEILKLKNQVFSVAQIKHHPILSFTEHNLLTEWFRIRFGMMRLKQVAKMKIARNHMRDACRRMWSTLQVKFKNMQK